MSPRPVSQVVASSERYDYPCQDPRTYQTAPHRPSDGIYNNYNYYTDRQRIQPTYDLHSYPRQYRSPPRLEYHSENHGPQSSRYGEYNNETRPLTTQNGYRNAEQHYHHYHNPEETLMTFSSRQHRDRSSRQE